MANQEHLDVLRQGIDVWNKWREKNALINIDLSDVDLSGADLGSTYSSERGLLIVDLSNVCLRGANLRNINLRRADLRNTDLREANLRDADLKEANLQSANLSRADLREADLSRADLENADLSEAQLSKAYLRQTTLYHAKLSHADLREAYLFKARLREANLYKANFYAAVLTKANLIGANLHNACLDVANFNDALLKGADLSDATLICASFVGTDLSEAKLTGCSIFGISAWSIQLEGAEQSNLIITPSYQPQITVDNLEVAQFIYLLLNNQEIRDVIDTITSKVVLILGRFTTERKMILDTIRDELRKHNYSPILFDFEKPKSRDFTETVRTLAHLARFIIADLTDPSSIPQELQAIVPDLEVPVQPLLLEEKREYAMFVDFRKYHWVLPVYLYKDQASLIASLKNEIIEPANNKARELAIEKAKRLETS